MRNNKCIILGFISLVLVFINIINIESLTYINNDFNKVIINEIDISNIIFLIGLGLIAFACYIAKVPEHNVKKEKKEYMEKTPEVEKILDEAYQIFIDVKKAYTNFDTNLLRKLVTDELYNLYNSKIEMLKIKGEKKIINNFNLKSIQLLDKKIDLDVITYRIELIIYHNDYTIDSNNKIVRGNDSAIYNIYILEFVCSDKPLDKCPKCGNTIDNETICPYCHTHIQGVSGNMKLAIERND